MSWETILKGRKRPDTLHVSSPALTDTYLQEIEEGKHKVRGVKVKMKQIIDFPWEETNWPEDQTLLMVERAKKVLEALKDKVKYNIDENVRLEQHKLNDLTAEYMEGKHDELEDWVDGVDITSTSKKYARKGRFRTFLDKKGIKQEFYSYIKSKPELHNTVVGKTLKFNEKIAEEPTTNHEAISQEHAIAFLKFIITDNQFVGKQRKELFPKTFENKPLESIVGRGTIRLLPALNYILDHKEFDMEKDDFNIEVSGQTQHNMGLRRLKFNQVRAKVDKKKEGRVTEREAMSSTLPTKPPKLITQLFNKHVKVQFKTQESGDVDKLEIGRARGIKQFLEAIENDFDLTEEGKRVDGPSRKAWFAWLKTFDVAGKYKISKEEWTALNEWNIIHSDTESEKDELRQADRELRKVLPIGSLTSVDRVEDFFNDDGRVNEFVKYMKEAGDGTMRATPNNKKILDALFYQKGKPMDLITRKYGGKTRKESEEKLRKLSHLLQDEQYDSNRLRIEDVIELLRELEYEYKGGANMNMVMMDMQEAESWDAGIKLLLDGVKENYATIRKKFIIAIKEVMIEESKKADAPTVTWMKLQGGIIK